MSVKNSDLKGIREAAKKKGPLTEEDMALIRGKSESDPWEAEESDPWESEEEVDPWDTDSETERPMVTLKGLAKGSVESLPVAGALAGGAAGFMSPVPGGLLLGAGLGAAFGKASENAIEHNLLDEPKSRVEIWGDPIIEGVKGAASEAGGQMLGRGIGFLRGMGEKSSPITVKRMTSNKFLDQPVVPNPQRYTPLTQPARDFSEMGFERMPKPNASEIEQSAFNIGGRATPGMLSSNPNVQNLENMLSQKPSVFGQKVRDSYTPIYQGLRRTSEDLVNAPPTTRLSTGDSVKQGLAEKVRVQSKPLSQNFEDIKGSTKNILPDPKNLNRSADRLMNQPIAEVADLPQGKIISKYSDMIRNAKSIDTLKQIRTNVNEEMTRAFMQGRGQEGLALRKVKDSINRLERREIIKAAMANTPTPLKGEQAAKSLIDQIKKTNKGWAVLMGEIQKIAKAGKMGRAHSPEHFIRMVEDMKSEDLAQRLFNTKNYQGLTDVKKFAPEEFELLRSQRLNEIAAKSKTGDQIDPLKLVKAMEAEGPEARKLLFGPKSEEALKDLKNVLYNIPKKVGASDTPRGTMWSQFADNPAQLINPFLYGRELGNAYSYMLLQGGKLATIRSSGAQAVRGLLAPVKSTGGLLMMKNGGRESED